jgi:amino acid transporter
VGSQTPLADAAGRALGPWGSGLLALGVVVSTFGYLSGMTLAVPRALFAFGRDGFLPAALARVHPEHRTPHVAIAVQAGIVLALAVTSGFEKLALVANVAGLLLFLACCLAAWRLRRLDVREGGIPFRVPAGAAVPLLAVAAIVYLLSSVTAREWAVLAVVLAVGAALYALTRGARRAAAAATAGD